MKKTLIFGSVLAAAFFGGKYLYGLQNVGKNMVVDKAFKLIVTAKDPLLNTIPSSFLLTIETTIKNPTKDSLKLNMPFVQLYSKKNDPTPFASSQAIKKDFTVPSLGTVKLDKIEIPFTLLSLATVATDLFKAIQAKKPIGIWVKTTIYIDGTFKDEKMEFQEFKLPI